MLVTLDQGTKLVVAHIFDGDIPLASENIQDIKMEKISDIIQIQPVIHDRFIQKILQKADESQFNLGLLLFFYFAVAIIFFAFYILVACKLYRLLSKTKIKTHPKIFITGMIFSIAAGVCSIIDRIFWGGSLDFICISWNYQQMIYSCIFDVKDIFLTIGILLTTLYNIFFIINFYRLSKVERKAFDKEMKQRIKSFFKKVFRIRNVEETGTLESEKNELLIEENDVIIHIKDSVENTTKSKKSLFVTSGVIVGLILTFAILIPTIIVPQIRNSQYDSIIKLMSKCDNSDRIQKIGEKIKQIPPDYKDINQIEIEYQMILKEDIIIQDNSKSFSNKSSHKVRLAYQNLETIKDTLYRWDLSEYLNNVNKFALIYGKCWRSDNANFWWRDNDLGDGQTLSSDIPTKEIDLKLYNFTLIYDDDGNIIIRYENKNDRNDSFDSYKTISVTNKEIVIYCYYNKASYSLH